RHAAEAHAHHATAPPTKSSSVNSSGGLMGRIKWRTVSLSAITLTSSPAITFTSVLSGTSKLCSASTDRGSDSSRFKKASLHHALATIWLHNLSSDCCAIIRLHLQIKGRRGHVILSG